MLRLAMEAEPQPLGFAAEIALATGMRRSEACALRWPDLSDDGSITVSHALGNGPGGFYAKEAKAGSSARTIPLTKHLDTTLSARRRDAERVAREMGVALGGPHTGHAGGEGPALQPNAARQGLRRLLRDERP